MRVSYQKLLKMYVLNVLHHRSPKNLKKKSLFKVWTPQITMRECSHLKSLLSTCIVHTCTCQWMVMRTLRLPQHWRLYKV